MAYINRIRHDLLFKVPLRSRLGARGYKPLYVGGRFENLGGVRPRIAMTWDGQRWESLGAGLQSAEHNVIKAAAVLPHRDRLLVGGNTGLVGQEPAPDIPLWDGEVWQSTYNPPYIPTMSVQSVFYMHPCWMPTSIPLIRVGVVIALMGTPAGGCQVWAYGGLYGTDSWHFLGGLDGAMCIWGTGSHIFFGGSMGAKIQRWERTGANWWEGIFGYWQSPAPLGQGHVHVMTDYEGWLVAAGSFWQHEDYYGIAKQHPTTHVWHPLATDWAASGLVGNVHELQVWGDHLVAGGEMTATVAGTPLSNVARWDTIWESIVTLSYPTSPGFCESLTLWNNALIIGGRFHSDSPNKAGVVAWTPHGGLYRFGGGTWRPFDPFDPQYQKEDVWIVTTR